MLDKYFEQFYKTFPPPSRARQRLWSYIASLIPDDSKVLEIGSGPGWVVNLIKDRIKKYKGYDLIKPQVDFANSNLGNKNIEFVCGDASKNNVIENEPHYDALLLVEVLEHVRNDKALLKNIRQGVKLIISVPFEEEFVGGKSTKCAGHLRPYTIEFFKARYGKLLDIKKIEKYYVWMICQAVKK